METSIFFIAVQILVVLFSIVLHEVAHGAMANHLGDPTAKNLGRLTLNPFKHLDLFGSVLLPLMTFFIGGFVFGYAKPVPYNPNNLSDRKYGPARVALAGPLTNIAIAILFGLVIRFLPLGLMSLDFSTLLGFIVTMNLVLAVFNLMPVPPLDGHWLVLTFVPNRFAQFKENYQRFGFFLFILFILYGFPIVLPIVFWMFHFITGT